MQYIIRKISDILEELLPSILNCWWMKLQWKSSDWSSIFCRVISIFYSERRIVLFYSLCNDSVIQAREFGINRGVIVSFAMKINQRSAVTAEIT